MAAVGVVALLLSVGTALPVDAAVPSILRPGTRPWFATFGLGPAINIDDISTHFKLNQEVGYHFRGGCEGPALGFGLSESFGDSSFVLQLGPKFWWDIQPVRSLGLYLAPMVQMGYALLSVDTGRFGGDASWSFFDLQFGFEIRLVLDNQGLLFYRPITIDVMAGDVVGARYDMMFGGGLIF